MTDVGPEKDVNNTIKPFRFDHLVCVTDEYVIMNEQLASAAVLSVLPEIMVVIRYSKTQRPDTLQILQR
jgi:hypothetical protein